MHLCAALTVASWMLGPIGEVGANFSIQLISRTQFAKIKTKKVIAQYQCEKHKKASLYVVDFLYFLRYCSNMKLIMSRLSQTIKIHVVNPILNFLKSFIVFLLTKKRIIRTHCWSVNF